MSKGMLNFHPWWVPWHLERVRLADRHAFRDQAINDYRVVTGLYRDPDPERRPLRDEARAALARLTSESPQ